MTNKIGLILLAVSILTLGACTIKGTKTAKRNAEGSELSIKIDKPISIIRFKIGAEEGVRMTDFKRNESIFNSEIVNSGDAREREVILGVMKTPEEMPSGEIVLGTILHEGKGQVIVYEISAVESGKSGSEVEEITINDFKLELKSDK